MNTREIIDQKDIDNYHENSCFIARQFSCAVHNFDYRLKYAKLDLAHAYNPGEFYPVVSMCLMRRLM